MSGVEVALFVAAGMALLVALSTGYRVRHLEGRIESLEEREKAYLEGHLPPSRPISDCKEIPGRVEEFRDSGYANYPYNRDDKGVPQPVILPKDPELSKWTAEARRGAELEAALDNFAESEDASAVGSISSFDLGGDGGGSDGSSGIY